jgi:RHS repeat-associated protein
MNSFASFARLCFACAIRSLFSVKQSATIDGLHRSRRVLFALLAMTVGETAMAGAYPASYVFQGNIGSFGRTIHDSESSVCNEHAIYFGGTFYYAACQNVTTAGYDVAFKTDLGPSPPQINHYSITRIYYCSGPNDVLQVDLTCTTPLIALDDKNAGKPDSCVANPINPGTGSKLQEETDYIGPSAYPLVFKRFYNKNTPSFFSYRYDRYQTAIPPSLPGGALLQLTFPRAFILANLNMTAPIEPMTANWRTYYDRTIEYLPTATLLGATLARPDGKVYRYTAPSGGVWSTDIDIVGKLTWTTDVNGAPTGWAYTNADDDVENYDATGRLISIVNKSGLAHILAYDASKRVSTVTDSFGHQLGFTYDGSNRISTLTDPAGGVYTYGYDAAGNLASVTYPDNTPGNGADNPKRIYLYNESANTSGANLPNALTGLTDENGTRFATWKYDATGRAISSEHAGGAEKVTLAYNSPATGQTTVSDYKDSSTTANVSRTYGFSTILGVVKNNGISQPCSSGCGSAAAASTFDVNGNVASRTDFNGNKTTYGYDLTRNLETQRIEALTGAGATTPQTRTISTEWHANWRLPKRMAEPKRITTYAYNGDGGSYCAPTTALVNGIPIGVLCSKTITETTDANGSLGFSATAVSPANVRTWAYTYNNLGQMLTANGARTDVTDVTTYAYYATTTASYRVGDLATVTNALGHITTINSYDAHGRPTSITDANGLVTLLTYTPRGWLATRTVGGLLTQFTYDNVGQLTKVTLPDSSFIGYTYDAAHRLVQISNAAGDKLVYTLDLMGNRTKEEVFDAGNNVVQRKSRVFDSLSRLATELNAANTAIAAYTYDNNGNVKTQTQKFDATAANDAMTSFDYDPLNRLTKLTDALAGITQYAYNGVDHLVSVSDPKSLLISYAVDGLDNQKQLISPDTGTTNRTFDAAGNLKTSTDARSKVSTYSYDALNRVTGVTFSDTTPALGYVYDDTTLGNYGKGRLTKLTDGTGNTTFTYDIQGRLVQKKQTTGTVVQTVSYGYDTLGRMNSITYPSGKVLAYGFDVQGRINSIAVNGVSLVSSITYQPFGLPKSWIISGGPVQTRAFDLDGRQTSYPYTATGTVNLTYDLGNRIKNLTGTVAKTYGYDKLDRLTSYSNEIYGYDGNGNRSSHKVGATNYAYTNPTTSNRLTSMAGPTARTFTYDASGNITNISTGYAFSYDARGRMTNITAGSVNQYGINGLGQRTTKAGTGYTGTQRFVYGEDGKLLGEYDNTGVLITEHVYLNDTPIAAIKTAGAYLIQADHLNTPRAILGAANALVWKWDSDAFGTTAANENPSALGTFNYNPRFPGQYYDKESTGHYNYFRDLYFAKTGRYLQSDPIGLAGGINTYGYVGGNPVKFADPFGLDATNWNNTSSGRSRWNGPTNGNWGGQCWSGGQYSCRPDGQPGVAPPTDSGDTCYQKHDNCYDSCPNGRGQQREHQQCRNACDRNLVNELRALDNNPRNWPQPPRAGTDVDSRDYRNWAIDFFN